MIIRSWDFVPGYLIADGQPAQPLTGALDRVGGSVTGVSCGCPPAAGGWPARTDGATYC